MKNIALNKIEVGNTAEITKLMTLDMVKAFAEISEDFNKIKKKDLDKFLNS